MNITTRSITEEECGQIINTIRAGVRSADGKTWEARPNEKVAEVLLLQVNLGCRIGDIVKMRLSDIIKDGSRYRLDIIEEKTGKARVFTVLPEIYEALTNYCVEHGYKKTDYLFPGNNGNHISVRAVQQTLKVAVDSLGLERVSTHSFRKCFATRVYYNNNYDVELVRELLQHSSAVTTQRYIKVSSERVERAIRENLLMV